MTTNEVPCYFTEVYKVDEDDCLWTIYSFVHTDLAEQFIKEVPFVCSDIEYREKPRTDDGHLETHPNRPIFSNLENALADAKEFHKYGSGNKYKYHGRVFKVDVFEMQQQHYKNLIKKLTKENAELRDKFLQLQVASM